MACADAGTPRIFDPERIAARRERLARHGVFAPPLHRHAAAELGDRIAALERDFPAALEIGAGGASLRHTPAMERIARLFACDSAHAVARQAGGGAFVCGQEALALAPRRLDLLVSLLCLHRVNDLPGVLRQGLRALRGGGVFLAALPGEGTLEELRICLLQAEMQAGREPAPRIAPFASVQSLGNLLARAGFADGVADVERIVLRHDSIAGLIAALRQMGETAPLAAPPTPLPRDILVRAGEIYAERFAHPDGGIAASFPLVYLIGHAPEQALQAQAGQFLAQRA